MSFLLLLFLVFCGFFWGVQALSFQWDLEESSLNPLESGFESLKAPNLLGSPFVMMTMLFVLFDVELILLIPSILSKELFINYLLWVSLLFLLIFTLLVEWFWSGLKWSV